MWGCRAHWFTLPKYLRDRIFACYRIGQEDSRVKVSPSYIIVAKETRAWIMDHYGANQRFEEVLEKEQEQ